MSLSACAALFSLFDKELYSLSFSCSILNFLRGGDRFHGDDNRGPPQTNLIQLPAVLHFFLMLAAATASAFDPFTPRPLRISLKYPEAWRQAPRPSGAPAQRAENWLKRRGILSCPEVQGRVKASGASELAARLFPSATGNRIEIIAQALLLWTVQPYQPEADLTACWKDVLAGAAELMPESWVARFSSARAGRPELLPITLVELMCGAPLSGEILSDPDYSHLIEAAADCLATSQSLCLEASRTLAPASLRWTEYVHNSQVRAVRRIAQRLQDRYRSDKKFAPWLRGVFQVLSGFAEWSVASVRSNGAARVEIAVTAF